MLHLLKMDLYRMFRSRSLWVILFFTVLNSIFVIGVLSLEFTTIQQSNALVTETQVSDAATQSEQSPLGITVSMDSTTMTYTMNQDGKLTIMVGISALFDSLFTSKTFILICGIFTALFVNAERKNGFIKNIAGQISNRTSLIGAKMGAIAVSTFLIYVTAVLSILLASMLFFKENLVFTNVSGVLTALMLQFFLHYVFCLIILLLGTITDSLLPSLMSAILVGIGLSLLLTNAVELLLDKVVGLRDIDTAHYLLTQQVIEVQSQATSSIISWAIGIGAIYAVSSTLLSMITIRKRDIC